MINDSACIINVWGYTEIFPNKVAEIFTKPATNTKLEKFKQFIIGK